MCPQLYIYIYQTLLSTGEVQRNESLFHFKELSSDDSTTDLTFKESFAYVPKFVDEITELRNGTEEICKGNAQCIYDYTMTGNEAMARSTGQFIEKFKAIEEDIKEGMNDVPVYKYSKNTEELDAESQDG